MHLDAFYVYVFGWLFVYLLFELLYVFVIVKLTNQVPNLWERVKICVVGIHKSDFYYYFYQFVNN